MSLFKRSHPLLPISDQEAVVAAIQEAEQMTSGEIRVFIESKCRFVDSLDRAREIFFHLKMEKTAQRNGVLIYAALKDRQSCILGDEGIYHITGGTQYWEKTLARMNKAFKEKDIKTGLISAVKGIGIALKDHFPYDPLTDKNELPDEIVFGK